jgi:hypothetical protein
LRTIKLFITIVAAIALLALPIAASAHGRSGRRATHAPRGAGVVSSFRAGVLAIRMAGGTIKSADVIDQTALSCQPARRARPRLKSPRRRARAAVDTGDDSEPGDASGDDTADDPGGDDGSDAGSDDTGDDTGNDTGDDNPTQDDPAGADPAAKTRRGQGRGKGQACSPSALRRGVRVKGAKLSGDGGEWAKVVLLRR